MPLYLAFTAAYDAFHAAAHDATISDHDYEALADVSAKAYATWISSITVGG